MGPLIVIILRLLIPLTIFRWPLLGGLLSMAVDALDVVLITFLNMGDFSSYHTTDKYLDIYYLSLEVYSSLFWKNLLAKKTSLLLFTYRFIGFILFEITKLRILLFIFPNLFENFFIFYLSAKKIIKKEPIKTKRGLFIILAILLVPKMAQEYLLHFMEAKPWVYIKTNILRI